MQRDEKRCWFWRFPEGPGGTSQSVLPVKGQHSLCAIREHLILRGAEGFPALAKELSFWESTHPSAVIHSPTLGSAGKSQGKRDLHLSKESFFSKSKHFYSWSLSTYQEGTGGWPLAFVREVKTHLTPRSLSSSDHPHSLAWCVTVAFLSNSSLSFHLPKYWVAGIQTINSYDSRNLHIE